MTTKVTYDDALDTVDDDEDTLEDDDVDAAIQRLLDMLDEVDEVEKLLKGEAP